MKKLEHFQSTRVSQWTNGPKFDDKFDAIIGSHVTGPKLGNLFFSSFWISLRNGHTNSKDKNYFFPVLSKMEIAVATLCPSPRQIKLSGEITYYSLFVKLDRV